MSQRRVKSTPRSVKAQSKQVAPLRMSVKGQTKAAAAAATPVVPPTTQMMNIEFGPEDPFASIRYNRNTKLENQKLALHLLDATEATLKSSNLDFKPENYFRALWPLLDNEEKEDAGKMGKGKATEFNATILYLVAFVMPKVPVGVIKEEYGQIYAKVISSMDRFALVAPFVRAMVVVLQSVLEAFLTQTDSSEEEWRERTTLGELLMLLLQLTVDARPKVRKAAQDALLHITRLTSILNKDIVAFVTKVLASTTRRDANDALHLIPIIRLLLPRLDTAMIEEELIGGLLRCSALGNNHLTVAIYGLLLHMIEFNESIRGEGRESLLATLLTQQPPIPESVETAPSWITLFCAVLGKSQSVSTDALNGYFETLFVFFLCTGEQKVIDALTDGLANVYGLVKEASTASILCQLMRGWLDVKGSPMAPAIIRTAGDLCQECRLSEESLLTALGPLVVLLGEMHDSKQAKHATLIEKTLGIFVRRCGPEPILSLLPLNLSPSTTAAAMGTGSKATPRAWLLPILADNVSHARLEYFVQVLMPLSEHLLVKSREYATANKANDAKVYQVIAHQVWLTLPAFLTFPVDFASAFYRLAPILGRLLNDDLELRPVIAPALTAFIRRSQGQGITTEEDEESNYGNGDLSVLSSFSSHYLPILFNIFGAMEVERRGYILECIEAILSITEESMVRGFLDKVISRVASPNVPLPEMMSLLELASVLVKVVHADEQLLQVCLPLLQSTASSSSTPTTKQNDFIGLQKRILKVITELLAREQPTQVALLENNLMALESQLTAAYTQNLNSAIKKDRFRLLTVVIPLLPDECLHWIPTFLPEVVLGTKEVNQKTRLLAFDLLLVMSRRMARGGLIDAEHSPTGTAIAADQGQFMMMLIAGLAGASPHMISATIMALARVIFDGVSPSPDAADGSGELVGVLVGDVIGMLASASREVVKSCLGFIKVALVALDAALFAPHLQSLVHGLVGWSGEHHQNFKVKVRHLMERLVRKFGFEPVWQVCPEAHRKLLANIRKRKERLRRQKAAGKESTEDNHDMDAGYGAGAGHDDGFMDTISRAALSQATTIKASKATTQSTTSKGTSRFEEALNDSESDLSEDDGDGNGDEDMMIAEDSILHGINLDDDDEAIESVLSKKLSLASALNRKRPLKQGSIKSHQDQDSGSDDDDDVKVDDEGMLHIDEQSEDEHGDADASDSDAEEHSRKRSKAVTMAPTKIKTKRSDARRKHDKFEPYSYLPMIRATKKNTGGSGKATVTGSNKSKKTPKFYMKRA